MDRAEDSRAQELREKFGPFRVLVVGKANSGKTTVLQAVCGTKESPQVIRAGAKPLGHFRHLQDLLKDKRSVITPSTDRGKHSIEDELHFPSNPGFIFHDSPGFESGDTKELDLVRQFITERAKEKSIKKQLHVIWYCLPTDNDARLLSASERNFFQEYDTGHVPIIMIFTKFDSLDARAFQIFRSEGMSSSDAHARAIARANKDFDEIRLPNVRQLKYPPAGEVRMRNMHKEKDGGIRNQRSVDELLSKTASALRNDVLQVMLASVQRNNLELCMESAVKRGPIMKTAEDQKLSHSATPEDGSAVLLPEGQLKDFLQALFVWFPYINEMNEDLSDIRQDTQEVDSLTSCLRHSLSKLSADVADPNNSEQFNEFISKCVDLVKSESRFRDIDSTFPSWMQVLNLGAAMVIVAGRLFWLRGDLPRGFETTLASYLASNTIDAVREAIRQTLGSDEPLDSVEQAEKLLQIVMANRTTPQQ